VEIIALFLNVIPGLNAIGNLEKEVDMVKSSRRLNAVTGTVKVEHCSTAVRSWLSSPLEDDSPAAQSLRKKPAR